MKKAYFYTGQFWLVIFFLLLFGARHLPVFGPKEDFLMVFWQVMPKLHYYCLLIGLLILSISYLMKSGRTPEL